ncbi:CobQ/CobB/MinD/ParA family nucleotide binding protein [Actinokineospora auranticolor]|uniref:CobQ/CobB/MinD/ParA family nucleotide binding protein n=1 Tax=Actinokineospora auranticolor TaxID=155976 RepID=A0A2S6GB87_9PSEU|nr:AAA family ATPase [Actinokineospora auranticolor]PPK60996.1 CobQ/CobB/MinD/ParA family nucleotide binding protein [Actinokineospora auranticolor]
MPGTVITFYSFKGGVGRSFALANIAVLLARWGNRVLCVDWDLEAPGLHHYFRPMMSGEPTSGVVDLVDDFLANRFRPADHTTRLSADGVTLDLIAAGRDDVDYITRVQDLEWERFYDEGFGEYLERCRERWTTDYDFVLLDSRTGVSDIGGICTAHLPDRLVILFTANAQSMRGAIDIARRANSARDGLPFDRPRLNVIPVLSRFDAREEYLEADRWRQTYLTETGSLYHDWLDVEVPPAEVAAHLTLPYVSFWTFGERLAVVQEKQPTPDQISYALETVAALLAHDLDRTPLLAENRDAYVAAVRDRKHEFSHDIKISTPRSTLDVAGELIDTLGGLGLRTERSLSGDRDLLVRATDNARHLCLIVDGTLTRWQVAEVERFIHRTVGQDRRVIPVLTARTDPTALPGFVGNLRHLRLGPTRRPADVARELADQVRGARPLVHDSVDLVDLLLRTAKASLPAHWWELVDELVRELQVIAGAGDDERARDVAADLELAIRPRSAAGTPVPADIREAIEWSIRVLRTRARDTGAPATEEGNQHG